MKFSPNIRQVKILNLLKIEGKLSRNTITKLLSKEESVSKPTVIRDLNKLLKHSHIKTQGTGRAVVYLLAQTNPLLEYVDIDKYFNLDAYQRDASTKFNKQVFNHLNGLFTRDEKKLWGKSLRLFQSRIKKIDSSIYKRELERFIIELSWKSSQIEGNTYSLIEAESLIKQHVMASGHPKSEATMILNHKKAFEALLKEKDSYKNITLSSIVKLHSILTKDLVTPGIRSQTVKISGSIYTPPTNKHEIQTILLKVINQINITSHFPEKALIAACMIAYLQPFADGNKRTSRILSNAILLAGGYYPLSYRNIDR